MTKLNSKRKIPLDIKEYSTHIKKNNFFQGISSGKEGNKKKKHYLNCKYTVRYDAYH